MPIAQKVENKPERRALRPIDEGGKRISRATRQITEQTVKEAVSYFSKLAGKKLPAPTAVFQKKAEEPEYGGFFEINNPKYIFINPDYDAPERKRHLVQTLVHETGHKARADNLITEGNSEVYDENRQKRWATEEACILIAEAAFFTQNSRNSAERRLNFLFDLSQPFKSDQNGFSMATIIVEEFEKMAEEYWKEGRGQKTTITHKTIKNEELIRKALESVESRYVRESRDQRKEVKSGNITAMGVSMIFATIYDFNIEKLANYSINLTLEQVEARIGNALAADVRGRITKAIRENGAKIYDEENNFVDLSLVIPPFGPPTRITRHMPE